MTSSIVQPASDACEVKVPLNGGRMGPMEMTGDFTGCADRPLTVAVRV